jgi:hypothetical protein
VNFRVSIRPLWSAALPAALTVLAALPAGAATKTLVVPYAPLFESIPRATGERFSGYLIDSLRNNDAVEIVELPGEAEGGAAAAGAVSSKAATPDQRAAVAAALEDIDKGKSLLKKRNIKPALDAFTRAIQAFESNGPAVEDIGPLVDAHLKRAVALYFMGREDEASKVNLTAALRLKPDLTLKAGAGDDQYGDKFVQRFEQVRKELMAGGAGDVRVDTAPPNAKIWVDNRETPASPVLIKGLIPGVHYVTIKLPATDPYVQSIEIKKGQLAKISPDAGAAKSTGLVSGLLDSLGKNSLDDKIAAQLKAIASKSGADLVVLGGAFAQGKDMGIVTFLYSTRKPGMVELHRVTTDRDLLGVTVDINSLANQISDRLKAWGDPVALPRPVAADAKPGEAQVNEVDYTGLIAGAPVEKKEDRQGPRGPVGPGSRKPIGKPVGPITPAGGGGARPEEAAAAPQGIEAAGAVVAAATPAPQPAPEVAAAPPPPPTPAPAPKVAEPAKPVDPNASADDLLSDLKVDDEDKPAEAAPDPEAAKKAELSKVAATDIEQAYQEIKINQDSGIQVEQEQRPVESSGLTSKWWFWTGAAVVVAAAVGGGVAAGSGGSDNGARPVIKF